jgi:hypothetical protein
MGLNKRLVAMRMEVVRSARWKEVSEWMENKAMWLIALAIFARAWK